MNPSLNYHHQIRKGLTKSSHLKTKNKRELFDLKKIQSGVF